MNGFRMSIVLYLCGALNAVSLLSLIHKAHQIEKGEKMLMSRTAMLLLVILWPLTSFSSLFGIIKAFTSRSAT